MSIAIIGTGMAGLSAARALNDAGRQLQLFDKSRGSGGRMGSRRDADGSHDLGAQYFTARDPQFSAEVSRWHADGWIAEWQPRLFSAETQGVRLSLDRQQRFVGTPRMSALTRALLGDLPVRLACQITALRHNGSHWQLLDAEGGEHGPFTELVLALPAPQARALLAPLDVPALSDAIAQVTMEPTWAVSLSFAEPLSTEVDGCFVRQGPLSWFARHRSRPGRGHEPERWVLHGSAAWSQTNLETSAEDVIETLREAFARIVGCTLPASRALAHRWRYARASQARDWRALAEAELGLYICGDWCLSGRVEGAWLSGQDAARQLLERTQARPSNRLDG